MQIEPNPGLIHQSPAKLEQRKSLDFLRRIEPYQGFTPTPRAFFSLCAASGLEGGDGAIGAARSAGFQCRFLGLHLESLWPFERARWRAGAFFMIADAQASFARPSGRELQEREKETPASADPRATIPGS